MAHKTNLTVRRFLLYLWDCAIYAVGIVLLSATALGAIWLIYEIWRVNHPTAPWWGFLLHD